MDRCPGEDAFLRSAAQDGSAASRLDLPDEPEAAATDPGDPAGAASIFAEPPAAARPPGAPKRVVMYSASWCGYCNKARSDVAAHGVPFTEHDVERDPPARREYKRLGGHGVPLILVGEARLQGFSPEGFERLYQR